MIKDQVLLYFGDPILTLPFTEPPQPVLAGSNLARGLRGGLLQGAAVMAALLSPAFPSPVAVEVVRLAGGGGVVSSQKAGRRK